jgi:hypothetical protein
MKSYHLLSWAYDQHDFLISAAEDAAPLSFLEAVPDSNKQQVLASKQRN